MAENGGTGWLAIPDFRRLWLVGFILVVVRWLEMLAVGVFTYQVTGSAAIVAMMTMLRILPMGLFGAFFGAAADVLERRSALILVVVAMMASSLTVAALANAGALEVWHLAVASFVNGVGWATDNPVRRMMIGDVVGPERMGPAMSLDVGTNNASRMLGPTLGGVLLATAGIAGVFWLGAGLYVVGLFAALAIQTRSRPTGVDAGVDGVSFLGGLRDGIVWLRGDRRLLGVFLITIIFNVFGWPSMSMIPVIGKDDLGLGPEGVGLLASVDGVGAFAGALTIMILGRAAWYGRIYVSGLALFLTMIIGFAVAPRIAMDGAVLSGVVLSGAALLVLGVGGACFSVMQATLVYLHAPTAMRARLLGLLSVCIGTGPIGFFYLGFLAEALSAQVATMAMGAQGLVVLALTHRYWRAIG
ncbi:MAG: MFS transporter [Alphaproteobacteria bacterium]|nr:MFS transporter [Alphaproteobacteria bacterium]